MYRKIFTFVKLLIYLDKLIDKKLPKSSYTNEELIRKISVMNDFYPKKNYFNRFLRNKLSKAIKLYRSYEINEEWVNAKKIYFKYSLRKDLFKSIDDLKIGMWVMYDNSLNKPVKGNRYNEYYNNAFLRGDKNIAYLIYDIDKENEIIELSRPHSDYQLLETSITVNYTDIRLLTEKEKKEVSLLIEDTLLECVKKVKNDYFKNMNKIQELYTKYLVV